MSADFREMMLEDNIMFPFQDIKNGRFYLGDCLEVMKQIPDGCIDMILCDLPYGTTHCKWDSIINLEKLWFEYWRIAKPNAAIVLTASQPFTTVLINSELKHFKYEIIWDKNKGCQPALANIQPMKSHENVLVFGNGKVCYNPQKTEGKPYTRSNKGYKQDNNHKLGLQPIEQVNDGFRFPVSILTFPREWSAQTCLHPTQKPVALFEYLVKTYTNEGELVLDNCAGSGTTAIAAENTNRRWICIEQLQEYADKAVQRILSNNS